MSGQEPSRLRHRLRTLEQGLRDVESDVKDMEERLGTLARLSEQLADLRDERGDAGLAQAEAVAIGSRPSRQRSLLRRVARRLISMTLGTARRVWQAAEPDPGDTSVVRSLDDRPVDEPSPLLVVVDDDGQAGSDPQRGRSRFDELDAQTAPRLCVVTFQGLGSPLRVELCRGLPISAGEEHEPEALVARLGCGHAVLLTRRSPALRPAFLEQLQWLLACEAVGFVLGVRRPGVAEPIQVVSARAWLGWLGDRSSDERGLEQGRLGTAGPSGRQRSLPWLLDQGPEVVGKLVPMAGPVGVGTDGEPGPDRDPQLDLAVPAGLRRLGRYLVPVSNRSGGRGLGWGRGQRLALQLRPVGTAPDRGGGSAQGSILVLLSSPLWLGVDRLLGAVIEAADGSRMVVASVCGSPAPAAGRLELLERTGVVVYEPARFLAPELWCSMVEHIADRHEVERLVHVGESAWWRDHSARLVARMGRSAVVDLPISACHGAGRARAWRHLALSGPVAGRLERSGLPSEMIGRCDGWRLALRGLQGPVSASRISEIRRELGAPEGAQLVVVVADLVAGQRPEDVACLARMLETDPSSGRPMVLLIGEGPLAASVSDLARLMGLERFSVQAPRHSLLELAAAADVACSLMETAPVPVWPMAALSAGTPLVTTAVDDLEEVLKEPWADGVAVDSMAGLGEVCAAVKDLLLTEGRSRTLEPRPPLPVRH
jgi:hypothetical protein